MIDFDVMALFFTSSVLLALAPGPDNIFVLTQAAQNGRLAGLMVTLGLCSGLLVHTSAVALGLAAVIQASAVAFSVLKFMGAGYLFYLAWQAFRAGGGSDAVLRVASIRKRSLYLRGIIMNVTNPKVSIFFLAFLPQFVDPAMGAIVPQIMVLGALFIVATILVFGGVSLLAGGIGERFRKSALARKVLNRMAGTIFAGLALKLVLSGR